MAIEMSPANQSIVKKLNLEVTRDDNGNYRVDDRMIAQFYVGVDPTKRGVYTSRRLDYALSDAETVRKEHDAEMTRRSGFSTAPDAMRAARQRKAGAPIPVPPAPPPPPPVAPQAAPKPRVAIEDGDLDGEIELDDVELDNTNPIKRVRKFKEPPRRPRSGGSIFLSAARVLVKRPTTSQEALAKDAVLAMASAKVCRVAFDDIVTTLNEAGFLNARGERLVPPPKKQKE